MKKYLFTIMMVISVGIALPSMWNKIKDSIEVKDSNEIINEVEMNDTSISSTEAIPQNTTEVIEPIEVVNNTISENEIVASKETKKTFTQVDRTYWSDTLFIGDSRMVGLLEYADLGDADVFADSGMSVYKIFQAKIEMNQDKRMSLEEVLASRKYEKIYIMMGINELGYNHNNVIIKYQELINRIYELQPEAILFLGANLHVTQRKSLSDPIYNNVAIDQMNQSIQNMADGETRFYIDVNEIFDDNQGNLDITYTSDDVHVLGKYYTVWAEWLLTKGIEYI